MSAHTAVISATGCNWSRLSGLTDGRAVAVMVIISTDFYRGNAVASAGPGRGHESGRMVRDSGISATGSFTSHTGLREAIGGVRRRLRLSVGRPVIAMTARCSVLLMGQMVCVPTATRAAAAPSHCPAIVLSVTRAAVRLACQVISIFDTLRVSGVAANHVSPSNRGPRPYRFHLKNHSALRASR